VTDEDAFLMVKQLAREEGVYAAVRAAQMQPPLLKRRGVLVKAAMLLLFFADGAERYMSKGSSNSCRLRISDC